ncbi:MAG: anti-sigma factor [Chryseolinea sp.]
MNVEEYISSGILESYAQGELSPTERGDVEKNLRLYPELRKELAIIEEAQEALLMSMAIKPKASVKEALFAKINASQPEAKIVSITPGPTLGLWRFAAAASVMVALISSFLAYDYHGKWKKSDANLTQLLAQNQQVAQDYNKVNNRLEQIENDLNVANNPDFQRVVMKGTPNAPTALAAVYWNATTKEVYLSVQEMKALSTEKQYQLWAIIDGKPVDAGVFDGDIAGLMKMKNIASGATTFAVTIEPKGGKTSPSLETMQVAGNVIKG